MAATTEDSTESLEFLLRLYDALEGVTKVDVEVGEHCYNEARRVLERRRMRPPAEQGNRQQRAA